MAISRPRSRRNASSIVLHQISPFEADFAGGDLTIGRKQAQD